MNESDDVPMILIVNDQEWTARAVESILVANGYRVVRAHTGREALDMARRTDPDLVILDQQLPDLSGVEVCRQLRLDRRFGPLLPVIITTAGPSGRPQRLSAYEAGAWEFYGQPLDSDALLLKLRVYLAAYRQARELRQLASLRDGTGLYSPSGLRRRACEILDESRRTGRSVACVGWSLGGIGDAARLATISNAFRANGRSSDALGRLENGDLAVIAANTGLQAAGMMANRIREALARAASAPLEQIRTTVVAEDNPAQFTGDGEQLLRRLTLAYAA
jgi:PleD family two-component response regulator